MRDVRQRRARHNSNSGHGGGASTERWLVSYADFITLLFAFFTTMYAISTVDKQKFESMVDAMQSAFASGGTIVAIGQARPNSAQPAQKPVPVDVAVSLSDVRDRLAKQLKAAIDSGQLAIHMDQRGLVISIREAGSFVTGSAELSDQTKAVIDRIVGSLRNVGNHIRVEGHTDDVPIHTTKYQSNWELSTARATSVIAHLMQTSAINPKRLSAAGYGEYYPAAPNSSDLNRARNRRVDIVVLNPDVRNAEEPK